MKYKIYRSTEPFALGQLVAETDDINTTLDNQPYGIFYYKFTETNDYGTSKPSSPIMVASIAPGETPTATNGVGSVTINCAMPVGAETLNLEASNDNTNWTQVYSGTNTSFNIATESNLYKYWRSYGTYENSSTGNKSSVFEYTAPAITTPVLTINTSGENLVFTYAGGEEAREMRLEDQGGNNLGIFDSTSKTITRARPSADTTYYAVAKAGFVTQKSEGVIYEYKTTVRDLKATVNNTTKAIDISWEAPLGNYHDSYQIGHKLSSAPEWTWINTIGKTVTSYSIPLKANGTYEVKVNTVYGTTFQQGPQVTGLVANLVAAGSTPSAVNAVGTVTFSCALPSGADAVHLEGSNDKTSWVKVHTGTSYSVSTQANLYKYWRSYGTYNNVYIGTYGAVYEYVTPTITAPVLSINTSAENLTFTYTGGEGAMEMRLENAAGASMGLFNMTSKSIALARPNAVTTYHAVGRTGLVTQKSAGVAFDHRVAPRNVAATFNANSKKIEVTWAHPFGHHNDKYQIGYKWTGQSSWTWIQDIPKSSTSYSITPKVSSTYEVMVQSVYQNIPIDSSTLTGIGVVVIPDPINITIGDGASLYRYTIVDDYNILDWKCSIRNYNDSDSVSLSKNDCTFWTGTAALGGNADYSGKMSVSKGDTINLSYNRSTSTSASAVLNLSSGTPVQLDNDSIDKRGAIINEYLTGDLSRSWNLTQSKEYNYILILDPQYTESYDISLYISYKDIDTNKEVILLDVDGHSSHYITGNFKAKSGSHIFADIFFHHYSNNIGYFYLF